MGLQVGDVLDGRYVLKENIWEDGNHTYWRSYDRTLEREIVLYIVSTDTLDFNESWENIKITAGLQHPHIIPVYNLVGNDNYLYAVQFYARNDSILEYLKKDDLDTKSILQLARQIASGIDFIHSQGIIHQHIRPDIILLDEQMNPYLTEFHVPRNKKELLMKYGVVEYAAPEQFENEPPDYRCDIYAFGITLFELFVQRLPFETNKGEPYRASLGWLQQNEDSDLQLPSVRKTRPELPIGVDLVLRRLTHKDPEQCYQTATEAVDELYRVFYSGQTNIEGKLFISYATKDKEYVHKLAEELRRLDIDIWIDQDIEHGSDWGDSIENALKACDMMLLVTTEASMDSAYVNHEWSYFMGLGKPVYPFIPESPIPKNIHPRLNRVQLVQGTGDMLVDIANVVSVLAGGNPKKLGGLDE